MSKWHKIAAAKSLAEDKIHSFEVEGVELAVVVSGNTVTAFLDRCSHQPIRLSDFGCIFRGIVLCQAHGAAFDAESGKLLKGPATTALKQYMTKIENGSIYVSGLEDGE